MADVFTPELTFGNYQSGMMTPDAPGLPYRTIQSGVFSPADLFPGGVLGAWYDPSDLSSMFQDSAGTIPSALDSPVGKINDKSGNGNHLTQATAGFRPTLRQTSGLNYLEFDGVDDTMQSAAVNLSTLTAMAIFAGITLDTAVAGNMIVCNNAGTAGGAGGFTLAFKPALGANGPLSGSITDGVATSELYEDTAPAAPKTVVQTCWFNYAAALVSGEIAIRRDGAAQILLVSSVGPVTGNFANSPLNVGSLNSGPLFLDGNIYGLILLGGIATPSQITNTEAWMAVKTGVTL